MSTRQGTNGIVATGTIAIVGGGVSGALTAYHLVQQRVSARVVVVEPRPELGLGLAYSTTSLRHLLNVPAGKISALPAEPEHFLQWLRANHDSTATVATFAPRAVFGRYVRALLAATHGVEQVQAEVVSYTAAQPGAVLTMSDGSSLHADLVVLATGNFDPALLPGVSEQASETGVYAHNAWDPATYDGLAEDAAVALIGTGLTGVDVLLRLREAGHRGVVTAISRHGVLPNRHAAYTPAKSAAIVAGTPATCLDYLRAVRQAIGAGAEWRAVIDSLRATTNDLWLALPRREQVRFRRHLQRRWDVVRHRMAPPIADVIEAELAAGTLVLREGHLAAVEVEQGAAVITSRAGDVTENFVARRVINCTGPAMNYRRVRSSLLASLFAQGVATPGPLGGGFNTSRAGAVIDRSGAVSGTLFNIGPGRLGTLLESIAIPELRQQAVEMAALLAELVLSRDAGHASPAAHQSEQIAVAEQVAVA